MNWMHKNEQCIPNVLPNYQVLNHVKSLPDLSRGETYFIPSVTYKVSGAEMCFLLKANNMSGVEPMCREPQLVICNAEVPCFIMFSNLCWQRTFSWLPTRPIKKKKKIIPLSYLVPLADEEPLGEEHWHHPGWYSSSDWPVDQVGGLQQPWGPRCNKSTGEKKQHLVGRKQALAEECVLTAQMTHF